jgi:hypothetical protein
VCLVVNRCHHVIQCVDPVIDVGLDELQLFRASGRILAKRIERLGDQVVDYGHFRFKLVHPFLEIIDTKPVANPRGKEKHDASPEPRHRRPNLLLECRCASHSAMTRLRALQ